MNTEPVYALLAVGVNQTPGAEERLKHAELDAVRLAIAATSARGAVPPANAAYLLSNTKASDLDRELDAFAKKRPDFLMFYFGGHGNAVGSGWQMDCIRSYGSARSLAQSARTAV